jgi:hypothetical protein
MMKFRVAARFMVRFIDLDAASGMKVICGRVEGELDAGDEHDAAERVRAAIRARFPVCWSMKIAKVQAEAVN